MARPSSSSPAPRGIAPELLVSQIKSTAPYVFGDEAEHRAIHETPPAAYVRSLDEAALGGLDHVGYYRLCLSAHLLTCATLVPTDVDNQIRQKLWAPSLPNETLFAMAELVLEVVRWDFRPLSGRVVDGGKGSAWEAAHIDGHLGEWFTVAAAAYAALGRSRGERATSMREALLAAVGEITDRHSQVFGSLWRAGDGVGALRAAATIAHNFGDLDRVIEAWDVPVADPLRLRFHHLTVSAFDSERRLRYEGRLYSAGELYKSLVDGSSMALENHRHFALRKPRGLRTHPALRVPLGPFFDAWGAEVATRLSGEALDEVLEALVQGTERLGKSQGYLRAIVGIGGVKPELAERARRTLKKPEMRKVLGTDAASFERRWSDAAMAHLEEIPSRAR